MPPLFPPEYPYRPDGPLLSMGPSFSEEIARSVVRAIWHENHEQPHETDIRTAAGLTMLEAFRPRDQLECMLAAQSVAAHCAIMDNFSRAAHPDLPPLLAIKYRTNSVALNRMLCLNMRELEHRQSRPLPPHPGQPPASPDGDSPLASEAAPSRKSRARAKTSPAKAARPTTTSATEPVCPPAEPLVSLEDLPELPEDIQTRPDGTPGNLQAYLPKAPDVPYVPPREAPIMVALATRPKPWRMVNVPKDQAPTGQSNVATAVTAPESPVPEPRAPRGLVDLRERIFTGDALARFAATRLDPDAPVEPLSFEHEDSLVELELISTGGDPLAKAEQAEMMAAHPEGKPIVTFHHGTKLPSGQTLSNGNDEPPNDT